MIYGGHSPQEYGALLFHQGAAWSGLVDLIRAARDACRGIGRWIELELKIISDAALAEEKGFLAVFGLKSTLESMPQDSSRT